MASPRGPPFAAAGPRAGGNAPGRAAYGPVGAAVLWALCRGTRRFPLPTHRTVQIELSNLFSWAALPAADADALFDEPEITEALAWALALPVAAQNDALAAVSAWLPGLDAAKASALLVFGGSLVEAGAAPDRLVPGGLRQLADLRRQHDEDPAAVPAPAWRFAVIGLMALLCRSAAGRAAFQKQTGLVAWLAGHEALSDHFGYLLRLAETSDEAVLWVLFPAYETGLEISVSQVNNTFHLLTLLQPLVREHAAALQLKNPLAPTAPDLLRYAQGDHRVVPGGSDHNQLEWLSAAAYRGGPVDPGQLAWGEAPVSALPRVRGRVVLLATENEHRVRRSWDAGFLASMHDAHRPEIRLRRLLPAPEVRGLLAELHPPVAVPAPAAPGGRNFWQRLRGQ